MLKKDRYQLLFVGILIFICMFNLTLIAPAVKEFVIDQFDTSEAVASLFFTVEMAAYMIFGTIWGSLSDRTGRRKVFIIVGFCGSSVIYLLMTIAPSVEMLLLIRFCQGAMTVMAWSLLMTFALDITKRVKYGAAMGIVGMSIGFGNGFGAPIGGRLADESVNYPLYLASILFALAAVLALVSLKDIKIENRPSSMIEAIRALGKKKALLVPYAFSFVERFTAGFYVFIFPIMMSDNFGSPPSEKGIYLALFLIPFALCQYPFGKMADRYGHLRMLVIGSFGYGGLMCFIGFSSLFTLVPIMIVSGLFGGMMFPPSLSLTGQLSSKGEKGTSMGGFNAFGSLGFALGPLVAGVLSPRIGYSGTFIFAGLTVLLVAIVAVLIWKRISGGEPE